MFAVAALVVVVLLALTSASASADTLSHSAATVGTMAKPFAEQALQAFQGTPIMTILSSLFQFVSALFSGQAGALTPEVLANAHAALAWLIIGTMVVGILVALTSTIAKVGKLLFLVGGALSLLIYVTVYHRYLLAPLGL